MSKLCLYIIPAVKVIIVDLPVKFIKLITFELIILYPGLLIIVISLSGGIIGQLSVPFILQVIS